MLNAPLGSLWSFGCSPSIDGNFFLTVIIKHKMAPSIKNALVRGALVGVIGAGASIVLLNGLESAPVFGQYLPKFIITGVALATSSTATTFILPYALPFASNGSPALRQFEQVVLSPLIGGCVLTALISVAAPGAEAQGAGGSLKELILGASSVVAASYISEGMKWTDTVLG